MSDEILEAINKGADDGETGESETTETPETPETEESASDTTEESSEEGTSDETSDDSTSEGTEEETQEEEEVEEETPAKLRFGQIKEKYPNLLKEFPELRTNYFKAEQYGEYFPTVDDAKAAAQKSEIFDTLESELGSGKVDNLLSSIAQGNNGSQAMRVIADTILPELYKQDPNLYYRASKPAIQVLFYQALKHAASSKDENLKTSVENLMAFSGINLQRNAQNNQPDPKVTELEQQNRNMMMTVASNYDQEVSMDTQNALVNEIKTSLSKEKKLNSFTLNALTDTIYRDANNLLKKDPKFQAEMNALWNRAEQTGFQAETKARLKNAYLARVRPLLPAIRNRRLAEALGTKVVPKTTNGKTNVPAGTSSGMNRSPRLSLDEIRKKGMSIREVLEHGAK